MATPKPGEIRCPTCHRSTPPAAFCTQCGSAIPSDARIRPRGMDRDELQDRIRARRAGGDPYRRGNAMDEGDAGYERFRPEPEDTQARRAQRPGERRHDAFQERNAAAVPSLAAGPASTSLVPPIEPRPDITRDSDDWVDRPAAAAVPNPPPPPVSSAPLDEPGYVDNYDDAAYDDGEYAGDQAYEYDEWDDGRDRRSGAGVAFAILGFLALGVLALLGGAVLAGVFGGDPNIGGGDPTLTPSPTLSQSVAASADSSAAPSADGGPSGSPGASGEPVVFPDGFTAEAQPCIPGSPDLEGCDSNGASNSGALWVWVGFHNGTENDVITATVLAPDGSVEGEGTIDLARINCTPTCPGGWTYFPFGNLAAGTYEVNVERNGELAATTTFVVE